MKKHLALLTLLTIAAAFTVGCGVSTPKTPANPTFTKLAFNSNRSSDSGSLFLSNLDGTGVANVPFDGSDYSPSVSADGQKVVFQSNENLWTSNTDGSTQVELTSDNSVYDARISPDGSMVVYESSDEINVHLTVLKSDATTVALNATLPENMTDCYIGSFSPDSKKVVFECWGSDEGTYGLYTINVDGTGLATVLTSDTWYWLDTPTFSADGTKILFVGWQNPGPAARGRAAQRHMLHSGRPAAGKSFRPNATPGSIGEPYSIYSVNLDGSNQVVVVPNAWEATVLNSTLFYTIYNPDTEFDEIHAADIDGSNDVVVSDGTASDDLALYTY